MKQSRLTLYTVLARPCLFILWPWQSPLPVVLRATKGSVATSILTFCCRCILFVLASRRRGGSNLAPILSLRGRAFVFNGRSNLGFDFVVSLLTEGETTPSFMFFCSILLVFLIKIFAIE